MPFTNSRRRSHAILLPPRLKLKPRRNTKSLSLDWLRSREEEKVPKLLRGLLNDKLRNNVFNFG